MRTLLVYAGLFGVVGVRRPGRAPKNLGDHGFKNPESVIYDAAGGAIYVSNVNWRSRGKGWQRPYLEAPARRKGGRARMGDGPRRGPRVLAIAGGKLYAADIDQLVEIDLAKGTVSGRYAAPGAKFLNDLTADPKGASSPWTLRRTRSGLEEASSLPGCGTRHSRAPTGSSWKAADRRRRLGKKEADF